MEAEILRKIIQVHFVDDIVQIGVDEFLEQLANSADLSDSEVEYLRPLIEETEENH